LYPTQGNVLHLQFLITLAYLMLRRWNGAETGRDVNVELKSQGRPSQSRKESILNYLLMGKRGLYTKVMEGSDQEDRIKKISDLLEEGRILAAACLGELTITWKRS